MSFQNSQNEAEISVKTHKMLEERGWDLEERSEVCFEQPIV